MSDFDPAASDKNLVRGDDRDYDIFVQRPASSPADLAQAIDLTGSLLTYTLKRLRPDGGAVYADAVVVVKTSDDTEQIEISDQTQDATKGRAVVHLLAADTRFLVPGVYGYDVQLKTAANKVYTVARGRLYLTGDITAAEDGTVP